MTFNEWYKSRYGVDYDKDLIGDPREIAWNAATYAANLKHQEEIERLKAELEIYRAAFETWICPKGCGEVSFGFDGDIISCAECGEELIWEMTNAFATALRQRQEERKNE
jgi:hypothetical protein